MKIERYERRFIIRVCRGGGGRADPWTIVRSGKGEDTRRKLKETVGDAVDSARARARLARMELDDLKAELKDQAEDLKDDVRMKIFERLEKLESALQKDIEYAERQSENA